MGLQKMNPRKTAALARLSGLALVHASVGPDGKVAVGVTAEGDVFLVDRRTGEYEPAGFETSTSARLKKAR